MNNDTLYLPIKNKWMTLICMCIKREEYREIKSYWTTRLFNKDGSPKQYKYICFHNYKTRWLYYYGGVSVGRGEVRLGAPQDKDVYKIKIGSWIKDEVYQKFPKR